jgi:hypothetical protein
MKYVPRKVIIGPPCREMRKAMADFRERTGVETACANTASLIGVCIALEGDGAAFVTFGSDFNVTTMQGSPDEQEYLFKSMILHIQNNLRILYRFIDTEPKRQARPFKQPLGDVPTFTVSLSEGGDTDDSVHARLGFVSEDGQYRRRFLIRRMDMEPEPPSF